MNRTTGPPETGMLIAPARNPADTARQGGDVPCPESGGTARRFAARQSQADNIAADTYLWIVELGGAQFLKKALEA
jgi:hypothetical protein